MDESYRTIKYIWQLENFCFCDFYSNSQLDSPSFTVNAPVSCKWYLYMFPNGWGIDKHVAIFLKRCKKDKGPKEIHVRFKISLLDSDGNLCPRTPSIEKMFTKGCEWGHNEFIKRSDLDITDCPFLYQDTLTVICQITVIHPQFSGRIPRILSLEPDVMDVTKEIHKALELLYENQLHSDITLKSEEKTFSVHKCILKARLPGLFQKLINNHDTIFTEANFTQNILRYGYTGRFDVKDINPFNIKKSLEEYGLVHLEKDLIPQRDGYLAQTYFNVQKCLHSWKIFTSLLKEESEIVSPFISNELRDTVFMVSLEKGNDGNGNENEDEDRNGNGEWKLYIKAIKSSNDDIFVRCRISVSEWNSSVTYEHKYTPNEFWESPFTIRLENDILTFSDLKKGDLFRLNGDFFCLKFVFTYPGGRDHSSLLLVNTGNTSFTPGSNINDSKKLLSDLEKLYYKHYESDTTVIAGKKEFKVHKCILCARSPVFRAMFTHGMKEKENNRVHLKSDQLDESRFADVIDKLLLFTYCGKREAESPEFADDLDSVIEMYMIGKNYEDM